MPAIFAFSSKITSTYINGTRIIIINHSDSIYGSMMGHRHPNPTPCRLANTCHLLHGEGGNTEVERTHNMLILLLIHYIFYVDVDVNELLDAKEILVWPPICRIFFVGGGIVAS